VVPTKPIFVAQVATSGKLGCDSIMLLRTGGYDMALAIWLVKRKHVALITLTKMTVYVTLQYTSALSRLKI
jgi:hypothetical protein